MFGAMLLSYKASANRNLPAQITIATRTEKRILEVDPQDYAVRLVRRESTRNALPAGALICRSFAPIDAIVQLAGLRYPKAPVEVLPPHKLGLPWRARLGSTTYLVNFDNKGRARFSAQPPRK